MKYRRLGVRGPWVSAIGLGCMGLQSPVIIERALQCGITFFDTADVYDNEEMVGRSIRSHRQEVVIATKGGIVPGKGRNGHPGYIKGACELSLKRLGVEMIDLYYLHRVDPQVPVEETIGAMAELVVEGKVSYLGISAPTPEDTRRARSVASSLVAVQHEYSIWERGVELWLLDRCRDLGLGLVAYSPLGRGFASGRYADFEDFPENDKRRNIDKYRGEKFAYYAGLSNGVQSAALATRTTGVQIALQWLLEQGSDVVPIPATTNERHLLELVRAAR